MKLLTAALSTALVLAISGPAGADDQSPAQTSYIYRSSLVKAVSISGLNGNLELVPSAEESVRVSVAGDEQIDVELKGDVLLIKSRRKDEARNSTTVYTNGALTVVEQKSQGAGNSLVVVDGKVISSSPQAEVKPLSRVVVETPVKLTAIFENVLSVTAAAPLGAASIRCGQGERIEIRDAEKVEIKSGGSSSIVVREAGELRAVLSEASVLKVDKVRGGEAGLQLSGSSTAEIGGTVQALTVEASGASIVKIPAKIRSDAEIAASEAAQVSVAEESRGKVSERLSGAASVFFEKSYN